MARDVLFLRLGFWLVAQLAILVFAVIAAWRHKLKGLWILAASAILAAIDDVLHMASSENFLVRHENTRVYLVLLGYVYYATMLTALCGWCVLALRRRKREKPDAWELRS